MPEAYKQQFRKSRKGEIQTHVEFAQEQQSLFERWCKSQDVKDLDDLKNLILLEQFKRCVHERIATHLNEHRDLTLEKAAVMADKYILTHKTTFPTFPPKSLNNHSKCTKSPITPKPGSVPTSRSITSGQIECHYCHTKGHMVRDCPVLQKKNEKPKTVALLGRPIISRPSFEKCEPVKRCARRV